MKIDFVPASGLRILAFFLAGAAAAYGTSCGSVAVATPCSIVVNGNTQYTVSNFTFLNGSGPQNYDDTDIDIQIGSGGGNTAFLTFSKAGGGVFLANSPDANTFLFTYDVVISAVQPGTVAFATPFIVSLDGSATSNAFSSDQMTLVNTPNGTSCQAFMNSGSGGSAQALCNTLPLNTTTALTIGNSIQLSAPAGVANTSILTFHNLLDSTFTAAAPGVPEPGTWSLIVPGLAAIAWQRRKTASRNNC